MDFASAAAIGIAAAVTALTWQRRGAWQRRFGRRCGVGGLRVNWGGEFCFAFGSIGLIEGSSRLQMGLASLY